MYQAVIFDMDGLLVDTERVWESAWVPAFEAAGIELLPGTPTLGLGCDAQEEERRIRERYNDDPRAVEGYFNHVRISLDILYREGAPLKPGAKELLDTLRERGIPCALASGSPRDLIEAVLGHAGVREYFNVVLSSTEGYASKPSPDVFLAACEKLGAVPAQTLVLEDSPTGVHAAINGKFPVVVVPDLLEPTPELEAQCVARCKTLHEVIELLD